MKLNVISTTNRNKYFVIEIIQELLIEAQSNYVVKQKEALLNSTKSRWRNIKRYLNYPVAQTVLVSPNIVCIINIINVIFSNVLL